MEEGSIKRTETRNDGITAQLSEKIPLYNLWYANVGIFSLSCAVIPSFPISVLFIYPYFILKFNILVEVFTTWKMSSYSSVSIAWLQYTINHFHHSELLLCIFQMFTNLLNRMKKMKLESLNGACANSNILNILLASVQM